MFRGMLLFLDPLKDNVRETVAAIRQEGVRLKIITGDNALIAANIAGQLDMDAKQIMTGSEIAALSKDELKARVREAELFAEVDPGQKEAIILALKEAGAVVGYMGDGMMRRLSTPRMSAFRWRARAISQRARPPSFFSSKISACCSRGYGRAERPSRTRSNISL